jgi:hypothetical protein
MECFGLGATRNAHLWLRGVFSCSKSRVPKGVKKCQIILLNVPQFYDHMVRSMGRIYDLRFTIFDLRVVARPGRTGDGGPTIELRFQRGTESAWFKNLCPSVFICGSGAFSAVQWRSKTHPQILPFVIYVIYAVKIPVFSVSPALTRGVRGDLCVRLFSVILPICGSGKSRIHQSLDRTQNQKFRTNFARLIFRTVACKMHDPIKNGETNAL